MTSTSPETRRTGPAGASRLSTPQLREHAAELGFVPQDQVRWLAPVQLVLTGVQVLLASAFSTFTDKRELQRSFPDDPVALPPDDDGGCWFDFLADTGDGFDATFTVASLVSSSQLEVESAAGSLVLPRGRLLVLGGDEVYPTASSERYEDRLKGPLRTALHAEDVGAERPLLVALPGNHDWYDGLTAFLRVFGQRRRIGGWQTVQGRSYFVVQLPNGWWLAGLDSQLGSEIDDPQLAFFRTQLSQRLQPGDAVILCCATPAWVRTENDVRAFDSFSFFERTIVAETIDPDTGTARPTGARIRLWITGDHHHYARYQEELPAGAPPGAARQLVTSGLGGAFLAATHVLPPGVTLPPQGSTERMHQAPVGYRLAGRWPSERDSRRLAPGLLALSARGLPFRNPGFWRLVAGGQAVLFLLLLLLLGVIRQQGPIDAVRAMPVGDVWRLGGQLTLWWVLGAVVSAAVSTARQRRPRDHGGRPREARWRLRGPALAVPGIGLQVVVGLVGVAAAVWLVRLITLPAWFPGGKALPNFILLVVMVAVWSPVAGLIGSYAVALTIALARSRLVSEWQFSAQAIEDRKGFVRIRIEPDGRLRLYPVVVDTVARRWRIDASGRDRRPPRRIVAADGLPSPYLVEDPVVILRSPTAS